MTTCGSQYPHNALQTIKHGVSHFLNEKSINTTVHPIWIFVIFLISMKLTSSSTERFILTTFAFYSVLLEMINSSIEYTNNRFGCEYNENTKIAKELSGAVTALSRLPMLALGAIIIYRNVKTCNSVQACY